LTPARIVFAVACLVAAGALAAAVYGTVGARPQAPVTRSYGTAAIGGPFHLVDQSGRQVDQSLLKGKWSVVFFGYTYCPDVCPTNLQTMAAAEDKLGDRAKDLQVVFVSIDPGRDTPKALDDYLKSRGFPKGAIGLTGTPAEVDRAAKAYKIYYGKVGTGANYTMDHSTMTFLMNPKGEFVKVLPYGMSPADIARQVSDAMDGKG
jgi:protein SCO1/2